MTKAKRYLYAGLVLAIVAAVAIGITTAKRAVPGGAPLAAIGDNLLINGGFEGPYTEHGAGEVKVAEGWEPFWSTGDPPQEHSQGPCGRPEYKPLPRSLDARRVVEGDTAACWFIGSRVYDAGLYQAVSAQVGRLYELSVSAQTWCSDSNDPMADDGEMYLSLGIDPHGRQDAFAQGVVWTPWQPLDNEHRRFTTPPVAAQAEQITVYIRTWPKWKKRHSDTYLDSARLVDATSEPPTPPPSTGLTEEEVRALAREEAIAVLHEMVDDLE